MRVLTLHTSIPVKKHIRGTAKKFKLVTLLHFRIVEIGTYRCFQCSWTWTFSFSHWSQIFHGQWTCVGPPQIITETSYTKKSTLRRRKMYVVVESIVKSNDIILLFKFSLFTHFREKMWKISYLTSKSSCFWTCCRYRYSHCNQKWRICHLDRCIHWNCHRQDKIYS